MIKGADRIYEWLISAIDMKFKCLHDDPLNLESFYTSRIETSKAALAWIGETELLQKADSYHAHAYHAFYNLRIYDYPTQ
jgi:hypothetical protein